MIKKIVIEIGDKEIKLTLEEAQELKNDLDKMLGNNCGWSWPSVSDDPWVTAPIVTYGTRTTAGKVK